MSIKKGFNDKIRRFLNRRNMLKRIITVKSWRSAVKSEINTSSTLKSFPFSREILLALIPFLFGFAIKSYSTGFDYHQKAIQLSIENTKEIQEMTMSLAIEADFRTQYNRILSDQIKSIPQLEIIASKLSKKELLKKSDYEFLSNNIIDVSKNLGKMQAYDNYKFSDDGQAKILVNLLKIELELTQHYLNNKWNPQVYYSLIQARSTLLHNDDISEILSDEREVKDDTTQQITDSIRSHYESLGWLNQAVGAFMFSMCLVLIVYGILFKSFTGS